MTSSEPHNHTLEVMDERCRLDMVKNIASGARYNIVNINKSFKIIAYCNTSIFISEVGNQILKMYPLADFACIYHYDNSRNQTKFSLRSSDDKEDVAKIAEMFGGGGHRNAAGCTLTGAWDDAEQRIIELLRDAVDRANGAHDITEDSLKD